MRCFFVLLFCFFSLQSAMAAPLVSHSDEKNYTIQTDNELTVIYKSKSGIEKYEKIPVLPNGNATIPKLGEVHVKQLTYKELIDLIKSKIDSETEVELIIYRVSNNVTVLGSVKNPGSFSASDIKTIYDAIGKAGGFTLEADKRHVKLIRQRTDGSRDEKSINFPKQVFKAYEAGSGIGEETYLLKEGDLIYVQPSRLKQMGLFTLRLTQIATIGVISGVVSVIIN